MTPTLESQHAAILRRRARLDAMRRAVTAGAERIYDAIDQAQEKLRLDCPHLNVAERQYGPRQAAEHVCEACGESIPASVATERLKETLDHA